MSSVPSLLSGQMGQFLRRSRANAFELQTVGGTELENRIQSAYGGTEIQNLPPHIQEVISADRALGGGGGLSGPLTLNNPFVDDSLTLEQQQQASNQQAISQGARPAFPGVQQRQPQGEVFDAATQAQQGLSQLVQRGTITAKASREIVTSVAKNVTFNQEDLRTATVAVKALLNQYNNGVIDQQSANETALSIQGNYEKEVLDNIPEWHSINNTKEQFQQDIIDRRQAKADSWNVPIEAFKADARTGEIVVDDDWQKMDSYIKAQEREALKPLIAENETKRKIISKTYDLQLDVYGKDYQLGLKGSNPGAALNKYNADVDRAVKQWMTGLQGLRLPDPARSTFAQEVDKSKPAPSSTRPPVKGLPPGEELFGTFPDFITARAANPPKNSYLNVEGRLLRRRLDGQYEAVQ